MPYPMLKGCMVFEMLFSLNPLRTRRILAVEALIELSVSFVEVGISRDERAPTGAKARTQVGT